MSEPRFNTHLSEIEAWLASLPAVGALVPRANKNELANLSSLLDKSRQELSEMQTAALWLRVGEIDRAHSIVQDDSSAVASYMHGMVHRIEGDYWNANYWFNRVRDQKLLEVIQDRVKAQVSDGKLPTGTSFTPTAFTNLCEQGVPKKNSQDQKQLQSIAYAEWLGVWEYLHFYFLNRS